MYDFLPRFFVKTHELFFLYICSFKAHLDAYLWKITLGKHNKFYGSIKFRKFSNSNVSIKSNCRFRSATWSNQLGINRPCMISTIRKGAVISIGNHCGFSGTVIAAAENIEIQDNVMCGANVTITDSDWHYVGINKQKSQGSSAPVCIEKNVWLGLNVTILKGVTIGRDTIIGAGSIVTHSIPARTVAAGQPAKVLRELTE